VVVLAGGIIALTWGDDGGSNGGGGSSGNSQEEPAAVKGGTIFSLESVTQSLDPQRTDTGRDIANMGKMYSRSLVQFPSGETDPVKGATPIPDLATDTGQSNEDATQWSFTLKDGPVWQDGKPITCEDLKYGVSRTFATDVITGGPNYALVYLDIPEDADRTPVYKGPYTGQGQDLFDKAVTCDGNTITYRFKKPWPDFPLAIASLRSFDPYRQDQDKGDKSQFVVFSDGPYMLQGQWNQDSGGTFVRNPKWDPKEDTNRQANPDSFVFRTGIKQETVIDRLIADQGDDANAISTRNITPAQYPQITGAVADRAVNFQSPFSNYLVPNFKRVTNPKVRQALAAATDRAAYSATLGGDKASKPSQSIVNPTTPGFVANPVFSTDGKPDIEKAKQLLQESGETLPYPIKLTYPIGFDLKDKAIAALQTSYDQAGFDVTLDGLDDKTGPSYDTIQPGPDSDLIWTGRGADWPSISSVIPPQFDSRINLSQTSNGQDYGNYHSDAVNAAIDAAAAQPDLTKANQMWADIDKMLAQDVAYIPLDVTQFYRLRGSNVENYVNSIGTSGSPDLGVISVTSGGT
jgi:peptide/nickel transport system substrate-binding protein